MLNMRLAEVETYQTVPYQMESAQAATRPLAGSGAGAFMCDGAQVGSPAGQLAVGRPLPRIRRVFGAGTHFGFAGPVDGSTVHSGNGSTVSGGKGSTSTKQLNQTIRIYPVTPGGLGPHPAREPDPV